MPLNEANKLLRPFYIQVFTQPKSVHLKHHTGLKLLQLVQQNSDDQSLLDLVDMYLDFLKVQTISFVTIKCQLFILNLKQEVLSFS